MEFPWDIFLFAPHIRNRRNESIMAKSLSPFQRKVEKTVRGMTAALSEGSMKPESGT